MAAALLLCGAGLIVAATPGAAGTAGRAGGGVEVVQLNGLFDPPNRDLALRVLADANRRQATLVVLKVASGGGLAADPQPVVAAIRRSRVPVAVWVGPAGAKAAGATVPIALAAPVVGVANGARIGPAAPLALDDPAGTDRRVLTQELTALNVTNGRSAGGARAVVDRRLSHRDAARLGVTDRICRLTPGCPTLGDFIVALDGRTVETASGPVRLRTARVVGEGPDRRRRPIEVIRFRGLDAGGQLLHTLAGPSIAYLLLVAGAALILFEFFTISIGLAGATGAVALVGAFVGFSILPVQWWAVALLLGAVVAFGVDVQAGRPYAWTVIGTAMLIVGTLGLYGGSSLLDAHWWVQVLVVAGTVVFMVGAMPVAVRSRFATPTVGREGLVGEQGRAVADVAPDGIVEVRGARWRARTNRATPIRAGEEIRVTEIQGVLLEVEPIQGGARDYRERDRGARRDRGGRPEP